MNSKSYFLLVSLLINVSTVKTAEGDDSHDDLSVPFISIPVRYVERLADPRDQRMVLSHINFDDVERQADTSLLISGINECEQRVKEWLAQNNESNLQVGESFSPKIVCSFQALLTNNGQDNIANDQNISFDDKGYYANILNNIIRRATPNLSIKACVTAKTQESLFLTIAPGCGECIGSKVCKMEKPDCQKAFGSLEYEETKAIFEKFGLRTILLKNSVEQASVVEKKSVSTSTFKSKILKYVGFSGLAGLGIWGAVKLAKKTTVGSSYLNSFPSFNLNGLGSKASSLLPAAWSGLKDGWAHWTTR